MTKLLTCLLLIVSLYGCGGNTRGTGGSVTEDGVSSGLALFTINGQVLFKTQKGVPDADIFILETGASTTTNQGGYFTVQTDYLEVLTLIIEFSEFEKSYHYEFDISEYANSFTDISAIIEIVDTNDATFTVD